MKHNQHCQREYGREPGDLPVVRHQLAYRSETREDEHDCCGTDAEHERELEFLQDGGDFFEERGVCCFFRCCAPGHVDAAKMADDCLRHVHRHTAEENCEEKEPLEVPEEAGEHAFIFCAVADDSQTDGTKGLEDDDDTKVNLEGVDVVLVQVAVVPPNEEVVCDRERPGGAERKVRADV